MTIQNISYGAVQTAYVSFNSYTLDTINTNIPLVWPTPYATSTNVLAATTALNCTATGCSINFPNANEVSLGMNVYIRNTGNEDVTVNTFTGSEIVVVPSGIVYWIQLTAYTTDGAGAWLSIQQGAGTSTANAADLAGYGLQAESTKLNTVTPIKQITTNYTVLASDQSTLLVSQSTGLINVTLPNFPAGFSISFNNANSGVISFSLPTSVTINNQPTFSLASNQTLTLISDGTNWWSLGLGQGTFFIDSVVSIDLSAYVNVAVGGNVVLGNNILNDFIHQFYASGNSGNITGDITIYYGNNSSNWYISSFCTTTNDSNIYIQLGTPASPLGDAVTLPMQQKLIFYAATNPLDNTLQLYSIPTVLDSNIILLANGTLAEPSLTFQDDQSSGLYLPNDYLPTIVGNEIKVATFDATNSTTPQILVNPGTPSYPSYSFIESSGYGMGKHDTSLNLFTNDNTAISIDVNGVVTFPTANAATLTNLMPTSVTGAIIYFNGTDWVTLPPGTTGQVLTIAGGIPTWVGV